MTWNTALPGMARCVVHARYPRCWFVTAAVVWALTEPVGHDGEMGDVIIRSARPEDLGPVAELRWR